MLYAEKITGRINGHDPVPFIKGHVQYATGGGVSHAINQDIQAPMLFTDMIEHRGYLYWNGNVSRKIVAANFPSDFFSALFMARMHNDLCALSRKAREMPSPML